MATVNPPGGAPASGLTRYRVCDAGGVPIAVHCRLDNAEGKRMWWEGPDGAPTLNDLAPNDLPLYGIHRLGSAKFAVLVEGEKAAEALVGIGIPALGTVTGAGGTPSARVLGELTGFQVYLWADNDRVGRAHMERIALALRALGVTVRLIDWPAAPVRGDAADFVAAGKTAIDVHALLDAAAAYETPATPTPAMTPVAWDALMSLDRRTDLPAFPLAALPGWVRAFVEAEAEATQTPPDMAAMFGLAALATVSGGHVEIEPTPGWVEGLNLFVVVAMEPGSRKSAVHADINRPIVEYEQLLVEQAKPDLSEQATIRRIAEASLSKAEKAAASAKDPLERRALEEEARMYASALERLEVSATPRLFTSDVTPEKLASLLHENRGRMAVLSAEGGIFDIMAGRYSSGLPNLDVYLQGHAGDAIRVDRRGRPTEFINRPALTVGLAVQPYVLARAARVMDFGGRGLLARFLYAVPHGNVGYRRTAATPVPDAIRQRYDSSLRALAASFDRLAELVTLRLTPEASLLFEGWRDELEPRRRPDADLGHLQGWSSKLDGAVARIAGLLHLADAIATGWETPVTAATMAAAIEIGRYLIDHAREAFGMMGADPRLEAARRISAWITAGDHRTFTKRDAFRALRGQALFPTTERLRDGLAALEELAWVRQLPADHGNGRPSARYESNPAIFARTWTKRSELPVEPGPDEVLSVLSRDSASLDDEPAGAAVDGSEPAAPRTEALWDLPGRPHPDDDRRPADDWGTIG